MIASNDIIVIDVNALVRSSENEINFIPCAKSRTKEFLLKVHEIYSEIYILTSMNQMVVRKFLRDNDISDLVVDVDLFRRDSSIFIDKNSIKFISTTKNSLNFTSMLNFALDFLKSEN